MKCTSTRRWILLALTDSLSARRNRKLNEHLEKCPACRTESRQARDLWEEIAHDETRDPGPTYWQSFASRVRRRIDAHDEAGAPVESLAVAARAGELWCRALAAAAVVLVVALALLDRPQEPPIFETDEILADVLQASELTDEILPAEKDEAIANQDVVFTVEKSSLEDLDPTLHERTLRETASLSGGRYYKIENAHELADQFRPKERSVDVKTERELRDSWLPFILIAMFAGLAAVLAAVGLYGVVSYGATRRTREIGLRVALGARQRSIVGLVLAQGMAPALVGMITGLIGAWFGGQVMETLLFGVRSRDPWIFTAAGLLLLTVALVATSVPAFRASRIDPATALRLD